MKKLLFIALSLFMAGASWADPEPDLRVERIKANLRYTNLFQVSISRANVLDFQGLAASPGNPPAGIGRLYFNTGTGQLSCVTSSGASCLSAATTHGIVYTCAVGQQGFSAPTSGTIITATCPTIAANTLQAGDIITFRWTGEVQTDATHSGNITQEFRFDNSTIISWGSQCNGSLTAPSSVFDTNFTGDVIIGAGNNPPSGNVAIAYSTCQVPVGSSMLIPQNSDSNPTIDPTLAHVPRVVVTANAPIGYSLTTTKFSVVITR